MLGKAYKDPTPKEDHSKDHLIGLELTNRHRYGDDTDILRANFTKSKEEIENEKFLLIVATRKLLQRIFWLLKTIPKIERYQMGLQLRTSGYELLRHSIAIKKRYYRKNMLEFMDIELEVLRNLVRIGHLEYPEWITDKVLTITLEAINDVGALCGSLLKTTVV